eukprot:358480-Chlamydomonas_euryale.AAC.2
MSGLAKDVCHHNRLAVAPKCVPQHARELGLAVRHVAGVALGQRVDCLLQVGQAAVDELSLEERLATHARLLGALCGQVGTACWPKKCVCRHGRSWNEFRDPLHMGSTCLESSVEILTFLPPLPTPTLKVALGGLPLALPLPPPVPSWPLPRAALPPKALTTACQVNKVELAEDGALRCRLAKAHLHVDRKHAVATAAARVEDVALRSVEEWSKELRLWLLWLTNPRIQRKLNINNSVGWLAGWLAGRMFGCWNGHPEISTYVPKRVVQCSGANFDSITNQGFEATKRLRKAAADHGKLLHQDKASSKAALCTCRVCQGCGKDMPNVSTRSSCKTSRLDSWMGRTGRSGAGARTAVDLPWSPAKKLISAASSESAGSWVRPRTYVPPCASSRIARLSLEPGLSDSRSYSWSL